jgi:ribosomal-protein-alanine N-acetyltransferase
MSPAPLRGSKDPLPLVAFEAMRRSDVVAVADLERRTFAEPWSAELFRKELRLPFSKVIVARSSPAEGSEVVGYVCRWLNEKQKEVEIHNVAVRPDWRRRSIGRRLVEHVIAEADAAGTERISLEVRIHNHPAIALYRSLGFREAGTRRRYYSDGEDALLMELRIDRAGP